MAGVVFQTEPDLSFTAGLARWLSQPDEPLVKVPEEGAEEEAAPQQSTAFETECVALEGKGEFAKLSATLGARLKELFATADEAALQSAYAIFLQLLVQWELLASKVEGLADELSAKPDERPALRRALLVSLYALVQQFGLADLRFAVLVRLVKFAAAAGQLEEVFGKKEGRVAAVERWMREWDLGDAQKKELLGLFFDAHADDSSVVYGYALKYLALFSGAELKSDAALKDRLVASVLLTIKSETLFQCDELAQLPVVKELEKETSSEVKLLYRLISIFARETYAEYKAFADANAALLTKHGLDGSACEKKMRLLTLVTLGQGEKELSYGTIAKALQVEEGKVEVWVMAAIGAGLLSAKMDQVTKTVYVTLTIEREFAVQQWKKLHTSLGDWRESIRGLLGVIQGSRPAVN